MEITHVDELHYNVTNNDQLEKLRKELEEMKVVQTTLLEMSVKIKNLVSDLTAPKKDEMASILKNTFCPGEVK